MAAIHRSRDIAVFLERLGRDAISCHRVPASLAVAAGAVTLRKFGGDGRWHERGADRVRAYYWGVVRRRALGSGRELADLRERYLAATVAADMLEGGYPPEHVDDAILARFGAAPPRASLLTV